MSYYKQLIASENIPDGYERWSKYRRETTNFITDSIISDNNGGIVLGAGRCNDLDLGKLLLSFTHLLLVDRDVEAMAEAIVKYGLENDSRVKMLQCEFTMVEDEDYIEFEYMLSDKRPVEKVIEWFSQFGSQRDFSAIINGYMEELKIDFNTIICEGIHSQLIMRFVKIFDLYKVNYSESECIMIYDQICILSECMSKNMNEQICNVNGNENIFIGYEYSVFTDESICSAEEIMCMFVEGKAALVGKMGLARVEGAYQCEEDISDRFNSGDIGIVGWSYSVWPFSENKDYLMINYLLDTKK